MHCFGLVFAVVFGLCFKGIFALTPFSLKYVVRPKARLVNDQYVIGHVNVSSKFECVSSCCTTATCTSVSWSDRQKRCRLADRHVSIWWTKNPYDHMALDEDPDWVTFGEIVYPVATHEGPGGRYSLSFGAAGQVCHDLGTVMATSGQVLAARAMGLDHCCCAWFADEGNGYVVQGSSSCGVYNTGITYCGSTSADVWCVMK